MFHDKKSIFFEGIVLRYLLRCRELQRLVLYEFIGMSSVITMKLRVLFEISYRKRQHYELQ